jgi:hypothetical protein
MTRIVGSPSGFGFGAGLPDGLDRLNRASAVTSNEGQGDRQGPYLFLEVFDTDPCRTASPGCAYGFS